MRTIIFLILIAVGVWLFGQSFWQTFSEKSDNVVQEYERVKDEVEEVADQVQEAKETVENTVQTVQEAAAKTQEAVDKVKDVADQAKEVLTGEGADGAEQDEKNKSSESQN